MGFSGNNIGKYDNVESDEACKDRCQKQDKCVGWVWYAPSSKGGRANQCILKKSIKVKEDKKETEEGAFYGQKCTGNCGHWQSRWGHFFEGPLLRIHSVPPPIFFFKIDIFPDFL